MNNFKKIIALTGLLIMLTSSLPITALATPSIGSNTDDLTAGSDVEQGQKTYYSQLKESNAETEVYLTVDESELLVSVPTTVVLDGVPNEAGEYTADYSVGVKGDISGTKTVTVTPESDTVSLKQVGKGDKEATVLQAQTDFTQNDFKNETVTTGHLSAQSLTAGSWNGTFDFLINVNQIKNFYSSLDLAAQDINAQTVVTKNTLADLATAQGAVCGVYKTATETKLVLLTDVTEQSTISLTQPVKINLNHYSVTFADGQYLTSSEDLTVINGEVNVNNTTMGISATGGTNFVLNNVDVNYEATVNPASNIRVISSNAQYNTIENNAIDIHSNTIKAVSGFVGGAKNKKTNFNNNILDITNDGNTQTNGFVSYVNTEANNNSISINSSYSKAYDPNSSNQNGAASFYVYNGSFYSNSNDIEMVSKGGFTCGIKVSTISTSVTIVSNKDIINIKTVSDVSVATSAINTNTLSSGTLLVNSGSFSCSMQNPNTESLNNACINARAANSVINGGDYYSDTHALIVSKGAMEINGGNFHAERSGIGLQSEANSLIINSTNDTPVNVYGGEWGASVKAPAVINGGTYTSSQHPLYVGTHATVNDALIYSTGGSGAPIYFGSSTCPEDAVLNLNRCTLGNPNATTQKGLYTIVSTRNYGYKTGAEVNITDCNLYQSSSTVGHMFSYHNNFQDGTNLNQTKFNLYGNTKLYKEYDSNTGRWLEYSKDEVASLIDPSWKTTLNGSTVGNKLVWSPHSVVTDGVLVTNNLTDDAGVYDYRD